jgi:predicted DNA-binding ribbon-helix-helix protein
MGQRAAFFSRLEMSFRDTLQEIAEKEGMSLAKFRITNRSRTNLVR